MIKTFLFALAYSTFMVSFIFGTAILMASGLWFIGIPVFIFGLAGIITWMGLAL